MLVDEVIADARQRRMAQRREQLGLTLEGPPQRLPLDQHLFQRDRRPQPGVYRFVDRAHPAAPDLLNDSITVLKQCVVRQHSIFLERERLAPIALKSQYPVT